MSEYQICQPNTELNSKLAYTSATIGKWGAEWSIGTDWNNVGSKLPAINNDFYATSAGSSASITVKQSGLYQLQLAGAAINIENNNDTYYLRVRNGADTILYVSGYQYAGWVHINQTKIVRLNAGDVIVVETCKNGTSGAGFKSGGGETLDIFKIA